MDQLLASIKTQSSIIAGAFADDSSLRKVVASVQSGKKIYATYLVVRSLGCSIKHAYNLVEEVASRLRTIELTRSSSPALLASLRSRSTLIASSFLNDQLLAAVVYEIQKGRKIAAIKAIREATSCGLREAKDLVDQVQRGLKTPDLPL